MLFIV